MLNIHILIFFNTGHNIVISYWYLEVYEFTHMNVNTIESIHNYIIM